MVGKNDLGSIIPGADGLLARDAGIFLSITVADCLLIFLYDPKIRAIGLLHAGWRGLAEKIISSGVRKMISDFGNNLCDIRTEIGPGIGPCHFEVKNDVAGKFGEFSREAMAEKGGRKYLDLKKIARLQLLNEGIAGDHIETSGECTHCLDSKYFSYRRDKPENIEAMMAIFGIRGS